MGRARPSPNAVHLSGFRTQAGNSSSIAPLEERGDRKAEGAPRTACRGGEGVRSILDIEWQVYRMRCDFDPLTRLAPADENAGGEPPSPPRGRGMEI